MNKRGWVKVIEAFVTILLIIGVLIIVINQTRGKEDISSKVYNTELAILREIELNDSLREEIVSVTEGNLPVKWTETEFESKGVGDVKTKIESRIPKYLDCQAMICAPSGSCDLDTPSDKDIYARAVLITSTIETYQPRKLKIFCWTK